MARYRKKPVVIEAFQVGGEAPLWFLEAIRADRVYYAEGDEGRLTIRTLEGEMRAGENDWIIQGVQGEIYPCKPDIFEQTYEPAELEPA